MKRVAVIDNVISTEEVYELAGVKISAYEIKDGQCKRADGKGIPGSHGTVCAALLVEFASDVEIIGISIAADGGEFSVKNVCTAFSWCQKNDIACICMSLGTTNWLGVRTMAKLTRELADRGVQIICAVSPDGSLTFPACYPWVIGVNCDETEKDMRRNDDFRRGYDIKAGNFSSHVLDKLCQRNTFFAGRTSSMAVPYLAGYLFDGGDISKLDGEKDKAEVSTGDSGSADWEIPIVRIRNGSNKDIHLLKEFQKREYMTALISDRYETDLVEMIVRLEKISEFELIMNGLKEASLVLISIREGAFSPKVWDYEIDLLESSIEEACQKIQHYFES